MTADRDRLALLFPGQGVGDPTLRERSPSSAPTCWSSPMSSPVPTRSPGSPTAPATRSRRSTAPRSPGSSGSADPTADLYAGHSLGEIAALAAAGAVDDHDGLRIVAARGRVMDAAAADAPTGGMLASAGDREQAAALAAAHRPCSCERELARAVRADRTVDRDRRGAEGGARLRPAREAARGRGRISLARDGAGHRPLSQRPRRRRVPSAASPGALRASPRRRSAPTPATRWRRR